MTVYRKATPPRHWYYDFREGGVRYAKRCVDPATGLLPATKTEARRIEDRIRQLVRLQAGTPSTGLQPGAFSLAQAMLLHLLNNTGSSALHRKNLKHYAQEILGFFGPDTAVTAITDVRIGEYRAFCAAQTIKVWIGGPRRRDGIPRTDKRHWRDTGKVRSAATCNHHLNCLRGALNAAHRTRDPVTGLPALPFPPAVPAFDVPDRRPMPMPEQEVAARQAVARPWTVDALDLARLFGLRKTEAAVVTVHHVRIEIVDGTSYRYLVFRGEQQKGGDDVKVHGGGAGSDLLARLVAQAQSRGVDHLVTWPGLAHVRATDLGRDDVTPNWQPLRSFRRSFKASARLAGIVTPHRYHDVRARYITELAKVAHGKVVQGGARHADFETTQRYIDAAEMDVASAVGVATSRRPIVHVVTAAAGEQKVKALRNTRATDSQPDVPTRRRRKSGKVA